MGPEAPFRFLPISSPWEMGMGRCLPIPRARPQGPFLLEKGHSSCLCRGCPVTPERFLPPEPYLQPAEVADTKLPRHTRRTKVFTPPDAAPFARGQQSGRGGGWAYTVPLCASPGSEGSAGTTALCPGLSLGSS